MKSIMLMVLCGFLASFSAIASEGLVSLESPYTVKKTADRFESIILAKGLSLFARIDHKENAESVNLAMPETELILFGNPKVGTPLMNCAPAVAIDLPQKVMIQKGNDNKVRISYNNPEYLQKRHDIQGCDQVISKIAAVLNKLSTAAISQ